jgi:hypothetical protein
MDDQVQGKIKRLHVSTDSMNYPPKAMAKKGGKKPAMPKKEQMPKKSKKKK